MHLRATTTHNSTIRGMTYGFDALTGCRHFDHVIVATGAPVLAWLPDPSGKTGSCAIETSP